MNQEMEMMMGLMAIHNKLDLYEKQADHALNWTFNQLVRPTPTKGISIEEKREKLLAAKEDIEKFKQFIIAKRIELNSKMDQSNFSIINELADELRHLQIFN